MRRFIASTIQTQTMRETDRQLQERSAAPPPTPSRKQRRRNGAFNRRLGRRLEAMKLPAKVEINADGGVHITVQQEKAPEPPVITVDPAPEALPRLDE